MRRSQAIGICLVLLFLTCCGPPQILLSPFPSQIERIEGYASLRVTSDQGSARSKFSFIFQIPDHGRIEVSDFLGRAIYQIIIGREEAFLVVPSKKVYWMGEEEEIIDKFLGFRLSLEEMISLLSGKWRGEDGKAEELERRGDWILERDEKGRIISGQRGELKVEVKEFIKDTPFARSLFFEHPWNRGRIKILKVGFNRPLKRGIFGTEFLEIYEQKTWAEIQEMIGHAD